MPYPAAIKELAYKLDPECWESYSGLAPSWKRMMDGRRSTSLGTAAHAIIEDILTSPKPKEHPMAREPFFSIDEVCEIDPSTFDRLFEIARRASARPPKPTRFPPLKINMMLHFYACAEPFAPEKTRTSPAYTQFVKELLRDGLIERPSKELRALAPGWAYQATEKGKAWVNAICTTPQPVEKIRYIIPDRQ